MSSGRVHTGKIGEFKSRSKFTLKMSRNNNNNKIVSNRSNWIAKTNNPQRRQRGAKNSNNENRRRNLWMLSYKLFSMLAGRSVLWDILRVRTDKIASRIEQMHDKKSMNNFNSELFLACHATAEAKNRHSTRFAWIWKHYSNARRMKMVRK